MDAVDGRRHAYRSMRTRSSAPRGESINCVDDTTARVCFLFADIPFDGPGKGGEDPRDNGNGNGLCGGCVNVRTLLDAPKGGRFVKPGLAKWIDFMVSRDSSEKQMQAEREGSACFVGGQRTLSSKANFLEKAAATVPDKRSK